MTSFTDLGEGDVNTDQFDPMRPMLNEDPAVADIVTEMAADGFDDEFNEQGPESLVRADGTIDEERGFVDANGLIRVWIDEAGVINKVRVSPSWREKVGRGANKRQLAAGMQNAFTQAFAVINIVRRQVQDVSLGLNDAVDPGNTPMTWEKLNELTRKLDEVRFEMQELPDDSAGSWRGNRCLGSGAKGKVQVELNEQGQYAGITFDPDWLQASRIRLICDAVPEAAKSAHSKFVPPQYEPGELDRLTEKSRALRNELTAMMKRGFF